MHALWSDKHWMLHVARAAHHVFVNMFEQFKHRHLLVMVSVGLAAVTGQECLCEETLVKPSGRPTQLIAAARKHVHMPITWRETAEPIIAIGYLFSGRTRVAGIYEHKHFRGLGIGKRLHQG